MRDGSVSQAKVTLPPREVAAEPGDCYFVRWLVELKRVERGTDPIVGEDYKEAPDGCMATS